MAKTPAWTRKEGKNPKGGLNAKGRASAIKKPYCNVTIILSEKTKEKEGAHGSKS